MAFISFISSDPIKSDLFGWKKIRVIMFLIELVEIYPHELKLVSLNVKFRYSENKPKMFYPSFISIFKLLSNIKWQISVASSECLNFNICSKLKVIHETILFFLKLVVFNEYCNSDKEWIKIQESFRIAMFSIIAVHKTLEKNILIKTHPLPILNGIWCRLSSETIFDR